MRIVVLGAGESGAGAAVLAKVKGFDTFVSDMSAIKDKYKELLDKYGIAWEEGHHTEELILNADEVVKSPGIPNDAPLIMKLKEKGTDVHYFPSFTEIENFLLKNCINGDLLITMGAGDIVNVGECLLGR